MANEQLPPNESERQRLREAEQRLILMKETGPRSAAWQRARLTMLWRIQQRLFAGQDRHPRDTTDGGETQPSGDGSG